MTRRGASGIRTAMARFRCLFPSTSRVRRRPRLAAAVGLEEFGFGVLDWRSLPRQVAVELLHAADRIARDGHNVAFTGRHYRAGSNLIVDGRLTVILYLGGQRDSEAAPPAERLITTLTGQSGSTDHIAVICTQPELSEQEASQALTRWRHTVPSGTRPVSVDVYGHAWVLHR